MMHGNYNKITAQTTPGPNSYPLTQHQAELEGPNLDRPVFSTTALQVGTPLLPVCREVKDFVQVHMVGSSKQRCLGLNPIIIWDPALGIHVP